MTHVVLAASEAYALWEAEGAELRTRRDSLTRQIMAAIAEQERVQAAYEQEVREAVEGSREIPPKPEPVDMSHLNAAMGVQQRAEEAHRNSRSQALVEAATTGALIGLEDREKARQARLAAVIPEIEECLRDAGEDATLVRTLIGAIDKQSGTTRRPSRAELINIKPDLETMLAAAKESRSLLEPLPARPSKPKIVVDDEADSVHRLGHRQAMEEQQSRLGLTGGGFGGFDDRRGLPRGASRAGEI